MELNCEYASGKGGKGELCCWGLLVISSFWLLNCELWPYSFFFLFFINTHTCGWQSAFLVNNFFYLLQPKVKYLLYNVFFWTLAF